MKATKTVILILISFSGFTSYLGLINPPEPAIVKIPDFNGRVLSADVVRANTFSVARPFASTEEWGKEAIMTYELKTGSIVFTAWRPDPVTPGIFEYAELKIGQQDWPLIYKFAPRITQVDQSGITLYREADFFFLYILPALTITAAAVASHFLFPTYRRKRRYTQ